MFRDTRISGHIEQFFGEEFSAWMGSVVDPLQEPIYPFTDEQAHVDIQFDGGEWTFGLYWPHGVIENPHFCRRLLSAVHECAHLFPFFALWGRNPERLFDVTPTRHERYAAFAELLFVSRFRHSFPLLASEVLTRFGPGGHPCDVAFDALAEWRMGCGLRRAGFPLLGVDLPPADATSPE